MVGSFGRKPSTFPSGGDDLLQGFKPHFRGFDLNDSCELVSENAKFPASWEYTGNFIDSGFGGASRAAKNDIKSVPYGPIP
jgi:hypothetical protein